MGRRRRRRPTACNGEEYAQIPFYITEILGRPNPVNIRNTVTIFLPRLRKNEQKIVFIVAKNYFMPEIAGKHFNTRPSLRPSGQFISTGRVLEYLPVIPGMKITITG